MAATFINHHQQQLIPHSNHLPQEANSSFFEVLAICCWLMQPQKI